MKEQVYHFGFGVDANYVKYAGVLMTNLLYQHREQPLCFHLACDGITEEDRRRLDAFTMQHSNVKLYIYDMTESLDRLNQIRSEAPQRLHRSVLLRVLLPQYVPQEVKRLVYMDADMICLRRLDELFELNLGRNAAAAVQEPNNEKKIVRLQLRGGRYFNAGLLVLDVALWRRQELTQRVSSYYQQHGEELLLLEQDALNAVLDGAFTELDKRYNFLIEVNNPLMCAYPADAAILHCVNAAKAWTKGCMPQIYDLYWRYVRLSPWHDLQPVEPTTAKAVFLAGVTAELQGEYEPARKSYVAVINRFTEYYQNKAPQLLRAVRRECLAAAAAEKQGEAALAVRCYGLAARRLMEQYLRDNPGLVDS